MAYCQGDSQHSLCPKTKHIEIFPFILKSISKQLLESPNPPLTAAALQKIICKRPSTHFYTHKKGMKNAF